MVIIAFGSFKTHKSKLLFFMHFPQREFFTFYQNIVTVEKVLYISSSKLFTLKIHSQIDCFVLL